MITCPRCGYQAPDGTPWCPNCGYGRPDPMQPKQPPVAPPPPPPPPPQQQKQDSSSFGGNCLAVVLMVIVLILVVFMALGIGGQRSKPKPTPTLIPSDTPTTGPTDIPTITPTPFPTAAITLPAYDPNEVYETDYNSYCGSMLQTWKHSAKQEDAGGDMQLVGYDSDQNVCRYTISGTAEGSMTLYLADSDHSPYRAVFEMDCSWAPDREILIDWTSVVGSDLSFTAPATIKRHMKESMRAGKDTAQVGSRYTVKMDRSQPVCVFEITKQ